MHGPCGATAPGLRPAAVVAVVLCLALTACRAGDDGRSGTPPVSAPRSTAPDRSAPPGTTRPGTTRPGSARPDAEPTTPGSTPAGDAATITWSGCGSGVECGSLRVPVDHDDPAGPSIRLTVARRPATGPGARIGTLFFNPGGPGAAGTSYVRGASLDTELNRRFDIVSWDPRGVGGSAPIDCDEGAEAYRALDWSPDDEGEQQQLDRAARQIADDCAAAYPDELAHVSTDATARDLDLLRRAVGDDALTFIGLSYGTAIGLRYAELFPDRVRAMVLDGVVDPTQDLEGLLAGQVQALEAHMTAVFARCRAPSCPVADAAATYDRVATRAERDPLPAGSRPTVGPTALAFAAISSSYQADGDRTFLAALAAADGGDGTRLRDLADQYWTSSSFTSYLAILCSDSRHPEGADAYASLAAHLRGLSPRFGDAMVNEVLACAFWPTATPPAPHAVHATGAAPILVVGNRGDVATPFANAQDVAAALDRGVLLTYDGQGHTSFGKSSCVDAAIRDYLRDAVAPSPARCP